MKATTGTIGIGRWIATMGGTVALGITLGLGLVTAATTVFQPGDAASDLVAANERQAAALMRIAEDRPVFQPGDAAGFAAADLKAMNERQAAGLARLIASRPVFQPGDAAGFAAADLAAVNERQAAALARIDDCTD